MEVSKAEEREVRKLSEVDLSPSEGKHFCFSEQSCACIKKLLRFSLGFLFFSPLLEIKCSYYLKFRVITKTSIIVGGGCRVFTNGN